MELSIRPVTGTEHLYCYTQSSQIKCQTGSIGYLRADMDTNGQGFFSTWNDFQKDLKTDEFKAEFDIVINQLRDSGFLKNRTELGKYCFSHPEAIIGGDRSEFGFRADTEKYSYMMRLNPNKGEYNLYCYCYRKDWLNSHLKEAERGIRFIDSRYNTRFRISDGEGWRAGRKDLPLHRQHSPGGGQRSPKYLSHLRVRRANGRRRSKSRACGGPHPK